jgi:DNA-binding transcriptional ArsR family regulator
LNFSGGMLTLMEVRPLFHPSLEDITVEGILHALSDPVRAAIFADIVSQDCSHNCSTFLTVSDKAIPKSTLSQHFRALREAGLIRGERRGVEMHNISRYAEIEERFPGLLRVIVNAHTIQSKNEAQAKRLAAKRSSRRLVKTK